MTETAAQRVERVKREKAPWSILDDIRRYAREGFDAIPPEDLNIRFRHWGLYIAPDLDTVMYTLSGLGHEARGWGLAEESFGALEMVRRYGGDGWFALGDRDLGTHLVRTEALARGEPLHAITARLFRALGVATRVLPMTDAPCRTMIDTADGRTLPFQEWFVRERAAPVVTRVWFDGARAPAPCR